MREPLQEYDPLSFSDFQIDLNSFYKNNFEKVIKREVGKNRRDEKDKRTQPAASAQHLRSEVRPDRRRTVSSLSSQQVGLPTSRLRRPAASKKRTSPGLNIKTSALENKGLEIDRWNSRRENGFSNMKSESLYDWYKYLKQSGRFKLGD